MWFVAIGVTLGLLGLGRILPRSFRDTHRPELGWMSQQWLSEHRAGGR